MHLTKNPLFYLSLILAVIVGLQTWTLVQAVFQEPTSVFPTSDVSAPVETGEVAQTKYETLSFAPIGAPSDVRVSVGLLGLRLDNGGSPGYATTWDMVKNFVRVWSGPDAGIVSYEGGVLIQREGGLLSMEVDSDGNVEIAGSLTTETRSKMWFGGGSGNVGVYVSAQLFGANLCGKESYVLYGKHEMDCIDAYYIFKSSAWEGDINKCVKNMRLYVTDREAGDWPLNDVGSNYENQDNGVAIRVYKYDLSKADNKTNTITVTVWKDSSKSQSVIGCTFVTKIKIDGVDGSSANGWIKGYLKADEIWNLDTPKFGD